MQAEASKPKPETGSRTEEATSKKMVEDLEDDEVTADLKDRLPVSPDGALDQDEELKDSSP